MNEVDNGGLRQLVKPGLGVLLLGLNPSLRSWRAGHYLQGSDGQLFCKYLVAADLIPAPSPDEYHDDLFLESGIGLLDICSRPTRSSRELSRAELQQGALASKDAIARLRPRVVASIYKKALDLVVGRRLGIGLAEGRIGESLVYALPFPPRAFAGEDCIGHMRVMKELAAPLP